MVTETDAAPGLVVLWVSRDPEAARNMALMYAQNSRLKGWWERVHLLVWGPSADVLAGDPALQEEVADCQAAGVEVFACRACAERYGVAEALAGLGITVLYTGEAMTRYLKDGWKVLSV
ncbi:MAG: DsrE family protein [Solidesulfovibrio sp. DCME]|uniref:DsrE family protein n=1 Tax=Solidesulfovibrio sp. DCME TaxID=3447380 RepID=UPI003D10BB72